MKTNTRKGIRRATDIDLVGHTHKTRLAAAKIIILSQKIITFECGGVSRSARKGVESFG